MITKYKIREDLYKSVNGHTVYRIEALKNFSRVQKGDLGGWIEKEYNLSQEDTCWVYGDACVYSDARVEDDARIYNTAQVYDNAKVCHDAEVYYNARVYGKAELYGNVQVYDNADVYGRVCAFEEAKIYGNTKVYENAEIMGDAEIYGKAEVHGNAKIDSNTKVHGDVNVHGNVDLSYSFDICGDVDISTNFDGFLTFRKLYGKYITYTPANRMCKCGDLYCSVYEILKRVDEKDLEFFKASFEQFDTWYREKRVAHT